MTDSSVYLMTDSSVYLMTDSSVYLMTDSSVYLMTDSSVYLMTDSSVYLMTDSSVYLMTDCLYLYFATMISNFETIYNLQKDLGRKISSVLLVLLHFQEFQMREKRHLQSPLNDE
jgi:hypothetical protein